MTVILGVPKELSNYENRISVVPEVVQRLKETGIDVLVESGAGERAFFTDEDFRKSGAQILHDRGDIFSEADIIACIQRPEPEEIAMMKRGSVLMGILFTDRYPEIRDAIMGAGVVAFALERIPRTTRAQSMDVLSSQSSVSGYRAAVLAASLSPRLMPMLTTAAGTVQPAKVLVIGAGVAGLMAIATTRRLGASVTAYDVRRAAGDEVRSLGAKFLEPEIDASAEGGYARELTEEERAIQRKLLDDALSQSDIVISTAVVPGRKAPLIITRENVESMSPGSVIVDIAAESGGNCELTVEGSVEDHGGVKIAGPRNLASDAPINASRMFARNVASLLSLVVSEGHIVESLDDEILTSCRVKEGGN